MGLDHRLAIDPRLETGAQADEKHPRLRPGRPALQHTRIHDGHRLQRRPAVALRTPQAREHRPRPRARREVEAFLIGLGPGFKAGINCDAVVETHRGHHLGRVYWKGSGQPDTGVPDPVFGYDVDRVLRAPASGLFQGEQPIGAQLVPGDLIARVDGSELRATFAGVLRGLLHDGLQVEPGVKVGDLDPRGDPSYCRLISDKSLAIGGGVLEALLARSEIRARLAG